MGTTTKTTTKSTTTTVKPAELCADCSSDADCGPDSFFMKCTSEGKCVCKSFWFDQNNDPTDGCETLDHGHVFDPLQCEVTTTTKPTTATTKLKILTTRSP